MNLLTAELYQCHPVLSTQSSCIQAAAISLVHTTVQDPWRRVAFVPAANMTGQPYASFQFCESALRILVPKSRPLPPTQLVLPCSGGRRRF